MSAKSDIKKFQKMCRDEATKRLRKLSMLALNTLVMTTPHDQGTAKGNWKVEINKMNRSWNEGKTDTSGGSTVAEGNAAILSATLGEEIIISNHVPYIVRLEHGHSRKNRDMMKQAENIVRAAINNKKV